MRNMLTDINQNGSTTWPCDVPDQSKSGNHAFAPVSKATRETDTSCNYNVARAMVVNLFAQAAKQACASS